MAFNIFNLFSNKSKYRNNDRCHPKWKAKQIVIMQLKEELEKYAKNNTEYDLVP